MKHGVDLVSYMLTCWSSSQRYSGARLCRQQ